MNDRKATFRLNSSWKTKVYINPNMKGKKRKEETGGMRRKDQGNDATIYGALSIF